MTTTKPKTRPLAAKATSPRDSAVTDPAVETFKVGTFEFTFNDSVPIPEVVARTPANPLPFDGIFSAMEAKVAKPGASVHSFLPDRFWTAPKAEGGREANPDAFAKPGYVKTKLRDAFVVWQKKAEGKRDHLTFLSVRRNVGDIVEGVEMSEPGFSYWLIHPAN